jgi:hypothetical protein
VLCSAAGWRSRSRSQDIFASWAEEVIMHLLAMAQETTTAVITANRSDRGRLSRICAQSAQLLPRDVMGTVCVTANSLFDRFN